MVSLDPRAGELQADYFARAIALASRTRTDVVIAWRGVALIVTPRSTADGLRRQLAAGPITKPSKRSQT